MNQESKTNASVPSMPLQLGWISYWNLLPLRVELERIAAQGGGEIDFHKGTPAVVNRWLSDGKVALAPSSSVCLLKNPQHEVAFPLGIASYGSVGSVYIGLYHEDSQLLETIRARRQMLRDFMKQGLAKFPGDVRKLAAFVWKMSDSLPPVDVSVLPPLCVSPASATSAALARVLFRLWFGEVAFEMRAAETSGCAASAALSLRRPMELLIGDEALMRRAQFRAVIDLGEAWRELTDLPFVFAVWQGSRKAAPVAPYWRQKVFEAAEIAQARMRIEPTYYLSEQRAPADVQGHSIDLAAYWKGIHYRLTPAHFRGLALYLALVRQLSPQTFGEDAVVSIMRCWTSLGEQAGSGHSATL